jgi:HD-GYP domain-containing protein (c-di-GMP phosphodiesterase class II)
MAVVDIYDSLVTDRAYRKRLKLEKVFEILTQEANGKKLDKDVVEKLIEIVSEDLSEADTRVSCKL